MKKLIFIILIFCVVLSAQDLTKKEQRLMQLEKEYSAAQSAINSLKTNLNKLLDEIDRKKSQDKPEEDEIGALMSRALTLSTKIDSKEKYFNDIRNNLEILKKELNKSYTSQIDSLQRQLNPHLTPERYEILEQEIFHLVEKRMYVSPILKNFSFNPQKIREIRLSAVEDNLEKSIYKNYLGQALVEIDSILQSIRNKENELRGMIRLEQKADNFLADIEDSRIIEFHKQTIDNIVPSGRFDTYNEFFTDNKLQYNTQIDAFFLLLDQLPDLGQDIGLSNIDVILDSSYEVRSTNEYPELIKKLKTTQSYLELYRKIIIKKLEE